MMDDYAKPKVAATFKRPCLFQLLLLEKRRQHAFKSDGPSKDRERRNVEGII